MSIEHYLIFIPGFYGSALKSKADGKRIWLTAAETMKGKQSLAMNGAALDISGTLDFDVDNILDHVVFVPGLVKKDIYDSTLKQLRAITNLKVIPFTYDWRMDLFAAVQQLDLLIKKCQQHERSIKISIVAHSMGGMIASYYLRYGTQLPHEAIENWAGAKHIDRVVMAGVPFRGVMSVFRNMQTGVRFGLNHAITNAMAVSSFISSYQLLFCDDLILNAQLEPIPGFIDNVENWQRCRWGLFNKKNVSSPQVREQRVNFIQNNLLQGRRILNLINKPAEQAKNTLSMMYIQSQHHPTLGHMVLTQSNDNDGQLIYHDKKYFQLFDQSKESPLFVAGDKTVPAFSSQLPDGIRQSVGRVIIENTKAPHQDLLKGKVMINKIKAFLCC